MMRTRKLSISRAGAQDWMSCLGNIVEVTIVIRSGTGNLFGIVEGDQRYSAEAVVEAVRVGSEDCILELNMDPLRLPGERAANEAIGRVEDAVGDALANVGDLVEGVGMLDGQDLSEGGE